MSAMRPLPGRCAALAAAAALALPVPAAAAAQDSDWQRLDSAHESWLHCVVAAAGRAPPSG